MHARPPSGMKKQLNSKAQTRVQTGMGGSRMPGPLDPVTFQQELERRTHEEKQ